MGLGEERQDLEAAVAPADKLDLPGTSICLVKQRDRGSDPGRGQPAPHGISGRLGGVVDIEARETAEGEVEQHHPALADLACDSHRSTPGGASGDSIPERHGRIDGLVGSGVRFFACQNTIANMSNTLGEPVKLNPHHTTGKGGIVRIKELVDQGYILVKP